MGSDTILRTINQNGTVEFQSTLPHGERPGAWSNVRREHRISIHAPAWGATTCLVYDGKLRADFNPRSRMGSDVHFSGIIKFDTISIHAPAWGATRFHRNQQS